MATLREHLLGFRDVAARVAARQRPGDGEPVMLAAAEEVRDRESGALAHRIEQRALDRALCEMIALHRPADQRHGLADAGGFACSRIGVM